MADNSSRTFDPILLEVLWNRLISITEEQAQTMMRTGFSNILSDAGDLSACLFDSRARMAAQATTGTPGHINALATGLQHFLRAHPPETLNPGDVLIGNNSYELSGHLYDFTIITPVFHHDRLVAYFGSTCHVLDIGGRGMTTECESIFEEGLYVPYLKYYRGGVLNLDLEAIIAGNSREPYKVLGDLRAQVIANAVAARQLCEMLDEFKLDEIDSLTARITEISEMAMREAISALPDGVYRNEVRSDGFEEPIRLLCTLKIRADEIDVDFTRSSPASDRAINVCLNFTKAYTFFAIKAVLAPYVANNDGSFRPIKVSAPKGSILNASFPMPTVARHSVSHFVAECVMGALQPVAPDKVIAEGSGATWDIVSMGKTDAGLFSSIIFTHGGMGARAHNDGLSATPFPSGIRGTPIEIIESNAPVVIHQYELRQDSGGPGKHRGGLGQTIRFGVRTGHPWRLPTVLDRTNIPPRGMAGGGDGERGAALLNDKKPLSSKSAYVLQPDDIVTFKLPGGGGYGLASEREPALVWRDVEQGYISAESAVRDYGINSGQAAEKLHCDTEKRALPLAPK
jgi:N-methylhydantoinase B